MSEKHEDGCGCADCYQQWLDTYERNKGERIRQKAVRDADGTPTAEDMKMMFPDCGDLKDVLDEADEAEEE